MPQARPALAEKFWKKLLHEEEFQQFAARHRHLKGLDTVEQVLEHLNIDWQRFRFAAWNKSLKMAHWSSSPTTPTGTLDGLAPLYAVSRAFQRCESRHLQPYAYPPLNRHCCLFRLITLNGRTQKRRSSRWTRSCKRRCTDFLSAGEVSRLTRRGIRDKNGIPALLSSLLNTARRCYPTDRRS